MGWVVPPSLLLTLRVANVTSSRRPPLHAFRSEGLLGVPGVPELHGFTCLRALGGSRVPLHQS